MSPVLCVVRGNWSDVLRFFLNIFYSSNTINKAEQRLIFLLLSFTYKRESMILLDIANGWKTAIMIVLMIAVFYLFLIKPQSDKAKKEAAYRDSLKAGDRLMTAGGVHVTFVSRDGNYAVVEAAPGVRMKVQTATLQPIPERKEKKVAGGK